MVATRDASPRTVPIYSDTSMLVFESIPFEPNSARLSSDADYSLKLVAESLLHGSPPMIVEVQGHADPLEGKRARQLGEGRARAVRARLLELGVPAHRLVLENYGASKPAASGPDMNDLDPETEINEFNLRVSFKLLRFDDSSGRGRPDAGGKR
jgi:outer membrane protein OmpA-like peptidoglycan-associated protein